MARIKIDNLPKDRAISKQDMKALTGGIKQVLGVRPRGMAHREREHVSFSFMKIEWE